MTQNQGEKSVNTMRPRNQRDDETSRPRLKKTNKKKTKPNKKKPIIYVQYAQELKEKSVILKRKMETLRKKQIKLRIEIQNL